MEEAPGRGLGASGDATRAGFAVGCGAVSIRRSVASRRAASASVVSSAMVEPHEGANVPRTSLPIPVQFVPLVAEIVVLWGGLDDRVEMVRTALAAQPQCAAQAANPSSQFNRRLNHFEALSNTYFSTCQPMQVFVRKTCAQIRVLKGQRDLFVHGRYGFQFLRETGEVIGLMLNDRVKGRTATRHYTTDKFKELNDHIGMQLARIWAMSYLEPSEETETANWIAWGLSPRRVDQIRTLLGPIRDHCHQSIRSRFDTT